MNNTEQIQNKQLDSFLLPNAGETYMNDIPGSEDWELTGVNYRASGNLLICNEVTKRVDESSRSGTRSAISSFSTSSGRRMRRYLRECDAEYTQMVTLTYPEEYPTDGPTCKEHLRRFLQEIQREFKRSGFTWDAEVGHSSFWFLEFQRRGAPHFHIFTNWAPDKAWISFKWYDIVGSGDDQHFRAGTRVEFLRTGRQGTIAYASKYAAKLAQKEVPQGFENIGRWWGVYGCRSTTSADIFVTRKQFRDKRVKDGVLMLRKFIETMVFEGRGRILKRSDGFLLVQIMSKQDKETILWMVRIIAMRTSGDSDMFDDAEVEYGPYYPG